MINPIRRDRRYSIWDKNVQSGSKTAHSLPEGAMLLDSLKTMEHTLMERGLLLHQPHTVSNPLWFLAETERNIFLWRAGCSLIEEDQFEFWVDVPALIEKRLKQLDSPDSRNPFLNPLWGTSFENVDSTEGERAYFDSLLGIFSAIQTHASALSHVASQLRREFTGADERPIVVLPLGERAAPEKSP